MITIEDFERWQGIAMEASKALAVYHDAMTKRHNDLCADLEAARASAELNLNLYNEAIVRNQALSLDLAKSKLEAARGYINALVEALPADDFCALVAAGKLNGIRSWLETK